MLVALAILHCPEILENVMDFKKCDGKYTMSAGILIVGGILLCFCFFSKVSLANH